MDQDGPTFRREAIAELMQRHGLSARQFASRVGISATLVGAWLAGVVTPQIGSIGRLCQVFGVGLLFFFDGDRGQGEQGSVAISKSLSQPERRAVQNCTGGKRP